MEVLETSSDITSQAMEAFLFQILFEEGAFKHRPTIVLASTNIQNYLGCSNEKYILPIILVSTIQKCWLFCDRGTFRYCYC